LEVLGVISSNEAAIAISNYQGNAETLSTWPVFLRTLTADMHLSVRVTKPTQTGI
jgi:hypothetical protein